ncbi:sensor domain-containing diguanylate cyclase [Anoxynatronum buryatiense]|uniref:Diguanylate cyclase (GGDEF) domain-containing protein n=1 Tax=Anoxynatronum buryatiense TaxID=489973 RepID=A0AA45WTP9_9CLOT|nr:diguanylate cyclase [Anoxynatronum buryatiense]SMP43094.1 diguanylate cyclase (GGDEF) domain-containing protein [Anoxynatronum buryatiense]
MIKTRWSRQSIYFKLTIFVIFIIIFQALLFTGAMLIGGVLSRAKENAYQSFSEKVSNRKETIEREMKNRWTNVDPYLIQIAGVLSDYPEQKEFFDAVAQDLIAMLRTTQTTGAFIILDEPNAAEVGNPVLYIRDYDPMLNDVGNKDLYMVHGPSELAKSLKIPLDQTWGYHLKLTDDNRAFFDQPYRNASLTFNAGLLGYWSLPFQLSPNDLPIVTYTMPLFNADYELRGIIGVEVSLNYLNQYLSGTDLQRRDSMGYLIAYSKSEESHLKPVITSGALQKRMIRETEPLLLTRVHSELNMFTIENHDSAEPIYACLERIGLYHLNTPFEAEEWYLVGMMTEGSLLSFVQRIQRILSASLVISILIGIAGGIFISYGVSRPIVKLAKQVRESSGEKNLQLNATGLLEVDELAMAMEAANNSLLDTALRMSRIIDLVEVPIGAFEIRENSEGVFVTDQLWHLLDVEIEERNLLVKDKAAFRKKLDHIFQYPEEGEPNVYVLSKGELCWLKIKITQWEKDILGIVMDVTAEMLEKNQIKADRDRDPLTGILNRKAFQEELKHQMAAEQAGTAALLMFDLDNLKKVNDTHGHQLGDQYILHAVEMLKTIAKQHQMVLGRRSGDEFVLLLHHFSNRQAIRECVNNFFNRLQNAAISLPDGSHKPVTLSGGLMWLEGPDQVYEEALKLADEALYQAKRSGKGSWCEKG